MSGNNNNNNNNSNIAAKKSAPWFIWVATLSDLALIICLSVWCAIVTSDYNYWKDECPSRYEYDAGDTDPCVHVDECDANKHCRVRQDLFYGLSSGDGDSCDSSDCGGGGCNCIIASSWEGLYVSFMMLFAFTVLVEAFRALLVISAAMMKGCDSSENEPIETSSLQNCMDSWTLIILRLTLPKQYERLIEANEQGKITVATRLRISQWVYREFGCGVIITLYPFRVGYWNPCQLVYILALATYVYAVSQHSLWVDSKKGSMQMINQPPIVSMVEIHQQQQIESHPNTASATTEGS